MPAERKESPAIEEAPASHVGADMDYSETWDAWVPQGWFAPGDEELITRDELLSRVGQSGRKVTTRSLQLWENLGLVPRPIRRWHEGAVRALYAPWVADVVERVAYRRSGKGRWSVEATRADVRDNVKGMIVFHDWTSWGGRGVPLELVTMLRELGEHQEHISGVKVTTADVHFCDGDGKTIKTMKFRLDIEWPAK